MHQKILIIGLDSGTWGVLNPLIDRGCMPHLKKLRDQGCHGVLRSTVPPLTPPAWTTLMTGVHPGKHHIISFEKYDCAANRLGYNTSHSIAVETMWSYLSRQGLKVASLNMPQTYPPFAVNGVMVSGYGCPGTDSDFTYPSSLKEKILRHIPDYDITLGWQGEKDMNDAEALEAALVNSKRCFENEARLFNLIDQEYDWNLLLIQIHQMDRFLHRAWHYVTPEDMDRHPERAEKIFDLFSCLDRVINEMASRAAGADDLIIVVSDHGHGPAVARVMPNILLEKWGYLKTQRTPKGLFWRLKKNLRKLLGPKPIIRPKESMILSDKLQLDWSATKAVVAHSHQMSCLYLNVKGRQPGGVVAPGVEYEQLLDELRGRFLEVRDPRNGIPVFTDVKTPQQLYGVDDDWACQFADLLLVPARGYGVRRSMRRESFINYADDGLRGMHYPEGMYLFYGRNVKTGGRFDADIADIVPTIYAALGVPAPDNLDGKVLQEAFANPFQVNTASALLQQEIPPAGAGEGLTAQEEQSIQQKLIDMGYL